MNRISIAMTTYNGDRFLEHQLNSILNQTLPPSELVVCDDGSTDRTLDLLEKFSRAAPFKVRVFVNPCRLGSVSNFEKAISLCEGNTIHLADQDDSWMSNKIAQSESTLEGENCGYAFSNASFIDDCNIRIQGNLWEQVGFVGARRSQFLESDFQPLELLSRNFVTGATLAFKADLRKIFLPFPQNLMLRMHHDAWIALTLSTAGFRGVAIPEYLIDYRLHAHQQIGTKRSTTKLFFRRLKSPADSLAGELATLNMVKRQAGVSPGEFNRIFGDHLKHIEFRSGLQSSKSRVAKIKGIISHYSNGGYENENFPALSALKDFVN